MRNIASIVVVIVLFCGMLCGTAYAETTCPEGTVAYKNTRTGAVVCFQGDDVELSSPASETSLPASDHNSISEEAQNDQEALGSALEGEDDQAYLSDEDIFIPPEYSAEQRKVLMARAIAQTNTDYEKTINDGLHNLGWTLDVGFGLGKGIEFVYTTRLSAGYTFPFEADGSVTFSLHGDAVLNFEWTDIFSMSFTLTPTLCLPMYKSTFSLGLGFGFMMTSQEEVERKAYFENGIYYLKREESINTEFQFTIKPILVFEMFMTEHVYWGMGIEIPIAAPRNWDKVTVFVNAFLNTGFRFD